MLLTVATFDYQSADLAAEERHYLSHHVALATRLPGLRLYYTGTLVEVAGQRPDRHRAAILVFDSVDARAAAMRTETGMALAADTEAHLRDLVRLTADAETIVAFDGRRPGQAAFVMTAAFDLAIGAGGVEAAERRYRDHHVALARQLPGLRHYVIGKLARGGGSDPERYRLAILAFDTLDALRQAYHSPVGRELRVDERETIVNARVSWLDARVEV
jgi:uncharacterized protein (TIGR02118 family)